MRILVVNDDGNPGARDRTSGADGAEIRRGLGRRPGQPVQCHVPPDQHFR